MLNIGVIYKLYIMNKCRDLWISGDVRSLSSDVFTAVGISVYFCEHMFRFRRRTKLKSMRFVVKIYLK